MLLPFSAAAGFGVDKPGGRPCLNLLDDDRCGIHTTLREDGWPGCTVFECFGAGQQVSQVTYAGVSWRDTDNLGEMGAVLSVMRQLHEMLVHLVEVERRAPDPDARAARLEIEALTAADAETLLTSDVDGILARVGRLLADASTRVRHRWPDAVDRSHDDLAGRRLAGDLRGLLPARGGADPRRPARRAARRGRPARRGPPRRRPPRRGPLDRPVPHPAAGQRGHR